jgi:hypothetical protein
MFTQEERKDNLEEDMISTRRGVFEGQTEYAEIRKMEINGVSSNLSAHIGCDVDFHIKYCMPLMEGK